MRGIWWFRPKRPDPSTDLQTRLRVIQTEAGAIEARSTDPDVKRLAYLLGYIAAIVETHARTGER